ncbi:SDR family oxidoreductase [Devosia faecipullorum]|uniref:SDR family oxidoreductase n=1 Tax=Devosia faecipullorum TaxID=2755039 RepID=UPI00187BB40B|nr:SDR family oxidoreductase [Devosia faecipullorum]
MTVPSGTAVLDLPDNWIPDGLVTTPALHQAVRFDQIDLDRWDEAADIELNGRFRIGQAVARLMLAGNGGSIVNLVHADGLPGAVETGSAATLSYATAGLSRGIALDLKDRVRSNIIALNPEPAALAAMAELVLFLCGPEGRAISGQLAAITPDRLQLFAQSRPLRVAHSDTGWDEASLSRQASRWAPFLPRLDMESAQ